MRLLRYTLAACALLGALLLAQLKVANNDADLTGKILMVADSTTARTVTNAFTFDRDPSAPFAVTASSAKVTNLDADLLDGITSTRFTWTVVTTTSTGTQNDFDPGIVAGPMVVRANNASALTITGFLSTLAYDGQPLLLVSIGAGQVNVSHQNTGSTTAADRLINFATSGDTPLAAGSGMARYVYDGTTARWRLSEHEQGAWITFTPNFGGATSESGQAYTTQTGRYRIEGRTVVVEGRLTLSTLGTITGAVRIETLPYTVASTNTSGLVINRYTALTTAVVHLTTLYVAGGTAATVYMATAAATSDATTLAQADLAATTDMFFSGTYETT